jgi:CRP/FNR family transcriptional regulator, nitrogen oxide reductase regulator
MVWMAATRHSPLKIKTAEAHSCTIEARQQILGQVPFLQGLTPANITWINSLFHEKDFQVNEVIYLAGDPAEQLFVVADGRVKLLRHTLAGKDILLDLLTPGEFFGSLAGLGNDIYPDTAQALSPCCILVIGREAFQQILSRYPSVALKLIEIMAVRLQTANERVRQLSALSVEGRIASVLLILGEKFGEAGPLGLLLQVPLTRVDLAGMTGTTMESVSRVMSRFQKNGLIRAGRGWVAVADRAGLEEIAGKELE